MGRIRRSFDINFKIRVCEAIDRGERTVLEVCREYQVQRPVVEGWLKKFVQGESEPKKFETTESAQTRETEKLKAKVGELTMQIDAFKKIAKDSIFFEEVRIPSQIAVKLALSDWDARSPAQQGRCRKFYYKNGSLSVDWI